MVELLAGAGTALWLGLLTSISPCPLATNVAAVSYIGRSVSAPTQVVWTGVLYAIGRMLAYVLVGGLLVYSLLSAPTVSHALQKYMIRVLGPLLVVAGVLLLEWIPLKVPQWSVSERVQQRLGGWGPPGGAALGFLFALAFCPVSAALFFGSLLPVATELRSPVLLPSLYGAGTAVPVIGAAFILATSASRIAGLFARVARVERVARIVTAIVFIVVGAWFTVRYTFGVPL